MKTLRGYTPPPSFSSVLKELQCCPEQKSGGAPDNILFKINIVYTCEKKSH